MAAVAAFALLGLPGAALAIGPVVPHPPSPKPPTPHYAYATVARVCPKAKPNHATCQSIRLVPAASTTAGAEQYALSAGASVTPGHAGGLSPSLLQAAYGYATTGGTGQTVGIVDAFNDPNIASDLAMFDTTYGLAACTVANGCLKVVSQTGSTTALPSNDTTGWSVEESLDVESVHSVCPLCKIVLVETNNDSFDSLATGVNEAVTLGATEVSNSYGGTDAGGSIPSADVLAYQHPGIAITASAGDDGYYDFDEFNGTSAPDFPSSDKTVVAVGGTTLKLNQNATRASEEVWDTDGPKDAYQQDGGLSGATGGGCSTEFLAAPWQLDLSDWSQSACGTHRLVSDISALADPFTGFDIYDSFNDGDGAPGWATYGGTSLATPIIAAMFGLAGGTHGILYPALTLYGHYNTHSAGLYDVTAGGNGWCGGEGYLQCGNPNTLGSGVLDCDYPATGTTQSINLLACDAFSGYDGPSGVGTPIGLSAFAPMAPTAVITLPPPPLTVGGPATYSASASTDPFPGGFTAVSYTWIWGDGTANSTGVSPSHTYTHSGTFTITLKVDDYYGVVGTTTATVTVPTPPTS
jgi:subtilase family serine protease